jgi:subtilisin family serine protease
MRKQSIISIAIAMVLIFSMFAVLTPRVGSDSSTFIFGKSNILVDDNPVYAQQLTDAELTAAPSNDPVPFNVAMVGANNTGYNGTGIYVAVLDTGLLSNWQYFFPTSGPHAVQIDTADGIGYTHNVWYVGSGGNFSSDGHFSYGPLLNTRGFITHDAGNPNPPPNPFPPGYNGLGSGHGTHVTSIITGYHFHRGTVDTWITGVTPGATIIPVLVLDDWLVYDPIYGGWELFTGGTWEMVAAGINYIGNLAATRHIKIIISMSLGGGSPSPLVKNAIDYAISQGCIVVAAAGNNGYAGMDWPGAFPEVISVAAAGWTQQYGGGHYPYYNYYWWWNTPPSNLHTANTVIDQTTNITYTNKFEYYLTDFSSRPNASLGQCIWDLDVASVGAAVRGPFKNYGTSQWAFYAVWGTSQATPHVSGMAAQILQFNPKMTQFQMELLLKTAAICNFMWPDGGAWVSDPFNPKTDPSNYPMAATYFTWKLFDAGAGFVRVRDALQLAGAYRHQGCGGTREARAN